MTLDKIKTLNVEQTIHWLEKTNTSILNCKGQRDMTNNFRLAELVRRYDDLKERAKILACWTDFCNKHGWDVEHNGFDCAG